MPAFPTTELEPELLAEVVPAGPEEVATISETDFLQVVCAAPVTAATVLAATIIAVRVSMEQAVMAG